MCLNSKGIRKDPLSNGFELYFEFARGKIKKIKKTIRFVKSLVLGFDNFFFFVLLCNLMLGKIEMDKYNLKHVRLWTRYDILFIFVCSNLL